jgi:hypothetical protein
MAKVTGPLFSIGGTGKLGEGICYTGSMGGARVILNPTHKDAYSAGQSVQRSSFITGKSLWRALSAASKAYYNGLAEELAMTGYNFYLKKVLLGQIGAPVWIEDSFISQISNGWDDCPFWYISGTWGCDRLELATRMGHKDATHLKHGGAYRWRSSTIPHGATILTAHMHLTNMGACNSPNCYTRIVGNLEANPAVWSTIADLQARRGTDASGGDNTKRTIADVQWHLPATMVIDTEYETQDFTAVLQEIVNQAAYAVGNAIAVFVDDTKDESSSDNYHDFYEYNLVPAKSARLHVTYKYLA